MTCQSKSGYMCINKAIIKLQIRNCLRSSLSLCIFQTQKIFYMQIHQKVPNARVSSLSKYKCMPKRRIKLYIHYFYLVMHCSRLMLKGSGNWTEHGIITHLYFFDFLRACILIMEHDGVPRFCFFSHGRLIP